MTSDGHLGLDRRAFDVCRLVPAPVTPIRHRRKMDGVAPSRVNAGNSWRKSGHSIGNGDCVEVASDVNTIIVRDSTDPASSLLVYSTEAWRTFLTDVKTGAFTPSRYSGLANTRAKLLE